MKKHVKLFENYNEEVEETHKEKKEREAKVKRELQELHKSKSKERLEMEHNNNCFIFMGHKDGNQIVDNEIFLVGDILNPYNQKISTAMLISHFDPDFEGYSCWISKSLITMDDINDGVFTFQSDINDLVNGNSSNDKEQKIFNIILNNSHPLLTKI